MKTLITQLPGRFLAAFCLIVFAAALPSVDAAEVFEGRVKMRITAGGAESQAIDYFVKGEDVRIEVEDSRAQGALMLMNLQKNEIRIVMPDQKMYMTMAIPDVADSADAEDVPKPTGEKKEILGYNAEKHLIESDGVDYEIWATDEIGAFGALRLPGEGQPGSAAPLSKMLEGQNFFPLLIVGRKDGKEETRVEVTEIEEKKLEDSFFEVPADYRGMTMPTHAPMK